MAIQSRAPVVLLTRPAAQSAHFAGMLLARIPDVTIVTSPLLAPSFLSPQVPPRDWAALIFTSQTAVEAARRIAADGTQLPTRALCVGQQTAMAAKAAGFDALSADGEVKALLALIAAQSPRGPLLHLHGRETLGNIGQRAQDAGFTTVSLVAYAQDLQPLSPVALQLLRRPGQVLAPVFSPRSATALAQECVRIHARAALAVIAISPAAATAFAAGDITVADHPDAPSMVAAIASRLKVQSKP